MFLLPFLASSAILAQTAPTPTQAQTPANTPTPAVVPVPPVTLRETVVVLGSPEPVMLGETARSGATLPVTPEQTLIPELSDVLRSDSSVDIQERGAGNVQGDVSIRGASFEQTLVLLNGMRVNDPQTSHFNLDVPVPLDAISGLDVLHGAGSTLYGSDAIGGVVNVRTASPSSNSIRLRSGIGSYGMNSQAALLSGSRGIVSETLAGSRDFSTGFIDDRDYRSEQASSETWLTSPLGSSDVVFAGSDRGYGAGNFYGPYPSFERTKGWFTSLQQQLGSRTDASVAYRRHSDRFVLLRSNPGYYTNQHIDESWQARLRRNDRFGSHFRLASGLEEDLDSIHSNNLGLHARNRGAGYAQFEVSGAHGNLSVGGREEVLSGGQQVFSPSVTGAVPVGGSVKIRGAIGYGFRLPTFTDLYYSDPTTTGNAQLQPESAWSYEGGADWFALPKLVLSVTGFTSPQHNDIDYTRASTADKWHATNLGNFRYSGVELSALWQPSAGQSLRAGWTFISGDSSILNGLQSEYVFRYPVNSATVDWLGPVHYGITSRVHLGITQRIAQAPYAVLDTSLSRTFHTFIQPYIQMTNLANTGYEEIQGVRMQGRAFLGGVMIELSRHR
ncbi:MAG TPA: TonB-dependent receptor [Acidobacteriaceae bacterium]